MRPGYSGRLSNSPPDSGEFSDVDQPVDPEEDVMKAC
jgi:hypothetical protein